MTTTNTAASEFNTAGNRNPAARYAGYRGDPCAATYTSDQSEAWQEGLAARNSVAQAAPHVGDSRFESWFSEYNPAHRGTKQQMRDAYAAGMGDPVAQAAPVVAVDVQRYAEQLVDVIDDHDNNAPEHRCYVSGAYEAVLNDLRAAVKAGRAARAQEQQP